MPTKSELANENFSLKALIRQLLGDLPAKRDWLDPQLEHMLRNAAKPDPRCKAETREQPPVKCDNCGASNEPIPSCHRCGKKLATDDKQWTRQEIGKHVEIRCGNKVLAMFLEYTDEIDSLYLAHNAAALEAHRRKAEDTPA